MQNACQKTNLGKEHRSIFHGLYNVGNKEGARGLYRGFSAAAIRECSYSALNLAGYEPMKELLGLNQNNKMKAINLCISKFLQDLHRVV